MVDPGPHAPPPMQATDPGRRRRGRILVAVAVVFAFVAVAPTAVSNHYADRRADDLRDDLAAAAAVIADDDLADLTTRHLIAIQEPTQPDPLLDVLGQTSASGTALGDGDGTVSLAFSVSWGIANRCVHLLLRPGQPPRTDVGTSVDCAARTP